MGAQPGDCQDDFGFSLPNHQQLNLDDQQCAERIAEHFAEISGQYAPLNLNLLPQRVQNVLDDDSTPPIISEYDCYLKMKTTKKPNSLIPGDLPSDIVKEFLKNWLTLSLNSAITYCSQLFGPSNGRLNMSPQ